MIKEQTTKRCEELIKPEHANWIGISNQEAIRELLNMLKEKDKEIEKLKKHNKELLRKLRNRVKEVKKLNKYSLYKKEFKTLNEQLKKKDEIIEKLEKEAQKYFEEIIKQARIIDLMAEQLGGAPTNKNIPNFEKPNLKECITIFTNKEDVKQYYESKATNDG